VRYKYSYLLTYNVITFTCEVSRHCLPDIYNVVTFTCEVSRHCLPEIYKCRHIYLWGESSLFTWDIPEIYNVVTFTCEVSRHSLPERYNVVTFTCEVSCHCLPERYNVVTFTCEVGPSSPWVRSRDYHATLQNLSSLSADWHPSSTPPPVSLCDCTQYDNNDKNDNTVLVINYTTNLSGRVSTKELHWDKYWTPSNHTINVTFQLHPMSSVHIFSLHSQPNSLLKL